MSFFVGIAFDDATRADFERATGLAKAIEPRLKWVRPEKAHLTLVFCGDLRPDEMVIAAVAGRHSRFSLRLFGGGTFEQGVLWLGVDGELQPLHALQADLAAALGVKDEHGGYTPHVTLARVRRERLPVEALGGFEGAPFAVGSVVLFETHQGEYRPLAHCPLRSIPRRGSTDGIP
ncbi:MAG: RNA 2',3'-cyclic phosphodiesterase [Archangiaceae bacterium]|nr:RNA 2',3'-cyclic phosphodiesterase [Archangiaceae bacterium]